MYGIKIKQQQAFDDHNLRIPLTEVVVDPCTVIQIKTENKDGYNALQVGFAQNKEKNITKPLIAHLKKAGKDVRSRYLKEIRLAKDQNLDTLKVGTVIKVADVFTPGDIVDVIGTSRGKGFTGVVKRHHFKGGPRTHGQSDRERAPGSIGQTTTPGRVYKGKRMAGRSGGKQITVKNLRVFKIDSENNRLIIRGLVPGVANSIVMISKNS